MRQPFLSLRFCSSSAPRSVWPHRLASLVALSLSTFLLASCNNSGGNGGTDPGLIFNRAPEVSQIQWSNPYTLYMEGDVLNLSVSATDADGDTLSYEWGWLTAPGGTYDNTSSAAVVLTVGANPGSYQASVTVSDGSASSNRVISFSVGTQVDAAIDADTVWAAANSPYILIEDAVVPVGVTLTLEAGVEVQMRERFVGGSLTPVGIVVQGALQGMGTAAAPIVLRGNQLSTGGEAVQQGIEVRPGGSLELSHFRILQAQVGVLKQGAGNCVLSDGSILDCQVGCQGLFDPGTVQKSALVLQGVEIRGSAGNGIFINRSDVNLSQVAVRNSGAGGVLLTSNLSTISCAGQLRRCELDSNAGGNLVLNGNSTVDMGCCNLIPAEQDGKNVTFQANDLAPAGVLPMVDCYWGIPAPESADAIRDATFDGRISATTWARETDLTGFRASAIDFNDVGDPCNS